MPRSEYNLNNEGREGKKGGCGKALMHHEK